jgi:heme-degrading monooxygenase HmoA
VQQNSTGAALIAGIAAQQLPLSPLGLNNQPYTLGMSRPEYLTVSNSELTIRVDIFTVTNILVALLRIAFDRFRIKKNNSDLVFFRLLGTGTGRTFTSKDANYKRWVILTVWNNQHAASAFNDHKIFKHWQARSAEFATYYLATLSSKGSWAGKQPFGNPTAHRWDGPVLSITRARIKFRMWRRFQKEVPPVSNSLHSSSGMMTAFGIGEAPIGLQGTVSVWKSNKALTQFAQREHAHRVVIAKTHELNWYSEELFARFAIIATHGSLDGVPLANAIATG